jgi:hypothetical protein
MKTIPVTLFFLSFLFFFPFSGFDILSFFLRQCTHPYVCMYVYATYTCAFICVFYCFVMLFVFSRLYLFAFFIALLILFLISRIYVCVSSSFMFFNCPIYIYMYMYHYLFIYLLTYIYEERTYFLFSK